MSSFSIKKNLKRAHKELLSDKDGMRLRASVSMIITDYAKFRYASVGNCRVLLLRNDSILYESRDQSLTENMVEDERLPKDKAAVHEERNNLYSYLGQTDRKPQCQISGKKKLANGDILLLTTRGIWENCSDGELLECAGEVSSPQELADNVEDLILGKLMDEIDNYTISVTFADKIYLNPKKRASFKKILAIVLPVAVILLALLIGLLVRYRIRAGKRADMKEYMESAEEYASYNNYERAVEEYKEAQTLAKSLKEEEVLEKIDSCILLLEQIMQADDAISDKDYEKANELCRSAQDLSGQTGGLGREYLADQQEKITEYLELFELLESAELKEDYGDYAGAIELYRKAKTKAGALYDKELRNEALEKMRSAEEILESRRQEELKALEERIQTAIEDEQVARDLENQSLMNDKKNALELESKGNDLMKNEDYPSAITYFETAMGMYAALEIHHPDGGVERFFYDAAGNRIKHVLPEQYDETADDGEGWVYAYDEGNRLISVTGPDGVMENTYAYDAWGNCVRKTDEKGCNTYYAYDLIGRLIRELAPVGEDPADGKYRMTSYAYDGNGNRVKEVRHGGTYDADGELLLPGEDLALDFVYDARDRLIRVEDGLGARISYRYDARGNRTGEEQVIRSGEGAGGRAVLKKIRYTYDNAGRLIKKSEILDNGLPETDGRIFATAVTGYCYDANGNRISITTPEGYRISRSYDDRNRLTKERVEDRANGIDRTTHVTYDRAGNITSVRQTGKEGQAREITYGYDLKDRLIHAGELEGPVFELSYDKNDRKREQRQLLPDEEERYAETVYGYDIRGNLTGRYRNHVLEEQNSYDIRGNRISTADGDGIETSCRYGLQNEQMEIFSASARKQGKPAQRLAYDARGRITGVEDGCGGHTTYRLDGWGRITAVSNAEGGQEQYAYDQAGNITETVDARGGKIRYAYNSQGKICAITDQSGNTETFHYDREGRQIRHTDRKGTVTETKYNVYGETVLQICIDQKGNRHVMGTWEYDDFGQMRRSVAGGFCYTYDYRPDGKLLRKWSSGKQVISCAYYKNGDLKSLTDVSGKTLYYSYDENGYLSTLKDEEGKLLTEYQYTAGGRLKEIHTARGFRALYEYDGDGNLSHLQIGNEENGNLLYDAFMVYDLNGNRTGKTGERLGADGNLQVMHTVYRYDLMNRLTEEDRNGTGERYAYDLCSNRLIKEQYRNGSVDVTEGYKYNERNELAERVREGSLTIYSYDKNGSLVLEEEGGKKSEYQYDLLNRQIYVKTLDGKEQENFYDGEGLRAELKENGKASTFLFYNGEILTEGDGDSEPIRRYLSGVGLSHVEDVRTGVLHTYHQDEQGSTAYITGNGMAVENCYVYDAFGNVLEKKEDTQSRILYTGQQHDQETGQYYLRTRYYNSVIGRFTQEDTYRGDGLNLYAYCVNNPVLYYDPSGHSCNNNGQNKMDETPADIVGEGDDRIVTVYRGTDIATEQIVYDETGLIMSDSARKTYLETGDIDQAYATSQKTHEEWIEIWGDEDTYVQAHGEFGTELSREFGMDRSMVSVTTDRTIAEDFAGEFGTVFELKIPESQLIPQSLKEAGESEFLIVNGT